MKVSTKSAVTESMSLILTQGVAKLMIHAIRVREIDLERKTTFTRHCGNGKKKMGHEWALCLK